MITESVQAHCERFGKSQAQVAREVERSPQALHNMLQRNDMFVVSDKAGTIIEMGNYDSYYRRAV
jgi:hypothetical protein